jgi:hypothetical protein
MKRSLPFLLASALAPLLVGQSVDSFGEAAKWIRGSDPLRNTQAIELIRRDRLVQLVPDLRRILSQSAETADQQDTQLAALDAMIDLGETMPPAEIQPFTERYPTFALILAARATGDTTPLLLDLMDRAQRYEAYVATANLLLPRHSTEFARRIMSNLRTTLHFIVMEPCGDCGFGVGTGWAGDSFGDALASKPGWPSVGHYMLSRNASDQPLAAGVDSIYYRRIESPEYADHGFRGGSEDSVRNRNLRNVEYVASMVGIAPGDLAIKDEEQLQIFWRDNTSFVSAARQLEQRKRMEYAALVETMVTRGILLRADAAGLKLNIRFQISDLRKDRNPALSEIN